MLIKNGKLYIIEGFSYQDLRLRDGRIAEILPMLSRPEQDERVYDAFGAFVAPGFIDLQVHGAAGRDFSDGGGEAQRDIARYLLRHGVTSYLAASDSFPDDILEGAFAEAAPAVGKETSGEEEGAAVMRGIHMTGPFIAPEYRGFHDERYLKNPDIRWLRRMNEISGGAVKMVDLSPELPGAREFVREASRFCDVSLAHSGADFDTARMCYAWGAKNAGDLYRDMAPATVEEPGLLGAAMDICRFATLQVDGTQIHPATLRMAYHLFTEKRICLTGNTSAYCGLKPDTYLIDGHRVTVRRGETAAVFEDGRRAGSLITLDQCVKLTSDMGGFSLALAFRCATENPARALGIFDEVGSITVGKRADLVVLDQHDLRVRTVFLNGEKYIPKKNERWFTLDS